MPVSVSPAEWVADEGTLLSMLKRHYGWLHADPFTLVRGERREF
jgi:hypothetical protein